MQQKVQRGEVRKLEPLHVARDDATKVVGDSTFGELPGEEIVAYWPALIDKTVVQTAVEVIA